MKSQDARGLSEDSLELLRKQAHRLRRAGHTWTDIAELIGVHLTTVKKWASKFDFSTDELTHAESDKRGRRFGEKRTLSMANEYWLKDQIVRSSPSQLALPFALWSRKAVHDVIYSLLQKPIHCLRGVMNVGSLFSCRVNSSRDTPMAGTGQTRCVACAAGQTEPPVSIARTSRGN